MYSNKISYSKRNEHWHKPLVKIKSVYDKLEKEMIKPPSDYEGIKSLVENENNSITKLQNNINIQKNVVSTSTHQKNNKMKK